MAYTRKKKTNINQKLYIKMLVIVLGFILLFIGGGALQSTAVTPGSPDWFSSWPMILIYAGAITATIGIFLKY